MRIGRTLPPAAAPLPWRQLGAGIAGAFAPDRAIRARQQEIRQAFGVSHVFLVSSGSAAIALTLQALKAGSSRTKVVIPAYTCFSVPAAVLKAGLRPVLCDITRSTFDFSHDLLERMLDDDTLCVIAHHLFGPSDIERTRALCRPRGIFVIEDAAQAMGAQSGGRKLGTMGDAGIFSFGRGKNVTCGSGGAIVTSSNEIAAAIAEEHRSVPSPRPWETAKDFATLVLMAVFVRPWLYWIPAALPFLRLGDTIFPADVPVKRLSGLKAGLLRGWSQRLARANRVRADTAAYFSRRLPAMTANGCRHPYLRLPIVAATPAARSRLFSESRARGLGLSPAYPAPLSEIPQMRTIVRGSYPVAQQVAARLFTIPTHEWLSDRDKAALAELCGGLRIS